MLACDYDMDDGPTVYRARYVKKARKAHKCCECKQEIQPGEPYHYVFGVWDGEADTFKTCEACDDLWDALSDLGFCIYRGQLLEDYAEYLEEVARAVVYDDDLDDYVWPDNRFTRLMGKTFKGGAHANP